MRTTSGARLDIRLLGTFEASLDGVSLEGFRSAKVRALLAYLAAEANRPHRRAALETLLWGEFPERDARQSLRQALFNLRGLLSPLSPPADEAPSDNPDAAGPLLAITAQDVELHIEPGLVDVDLKNFDDLVASADPARASSFEQPDPAALLAQAIALYRGPFLAGLSLPDCPGFEEWRLLNQAQRHESALLALERLVSHHLSEGRTDRVAYYARRQLALEPWSEAAHQSLMLALALEGQRAAALRQYEECRRVLAAELGVGPGVETETLARQIRNGRVLGANGDRPGMGDEPAALSLAAIRRPADVFVARECELARLDRFLAQAVAGRGRVALILGTAGAGKTALLARFARWAVENHRRLVVAGGKCSAYAGGGDPLLPFREILQTLCGEVETLWTGTGDNPEHTRRLWALFPQVAAALVDAGPDLIGRFVAVEALLKTAERLAPPGATWRARLADLAARPQSGQAVPGWSPRQTALFDQVSRVLQTLARQQPLVLLIDDLQWADGASLSLLFHLAQRLAGSRILVVCASRPLHPSASDLPAADGTPHSSLESLFRELAREWGDVTIDLDQAGGRHFVDAVLDAEPNSLDDAFRQTLTRHTGGHALFTVELLRAFHERGELVRDTAGRWVRGAALHWECLPARVEAVIGEQLSLLSDEWCRVLAAASVEGESFSAEVVARTLAMEPERVLHGLSGSLSRRQGLVEALGVQRLAEEGEPLSRYRFRHVLFREHIYAHLDPVQRGRLHGAVGQALEGLCGGDEAVLAQTSPQLALHFELAGKVGKAARYLLLAGRHACQLAAYDEAITLFRRGLALLAQLPDSNERARRQLELALALDVPLHLAYGWNAPQRMSVLTETYRLAVRLGEPEPIMGTLLIMADIYNWQADGQQALERSKEILSWARQAHDPFYLAAGLHEAGMSHFSMGQLAAAREYFQYALESEPLWQSSRLPLVAVTRYEPRVESLVWLSIALEMSGYADQALARSLEGLALAEEHSDPALLGHVLTTAGAGFRALRRELVAAGTYVEQLQDLAARLEEMRQPDWSARVTLPHLRAWVLFYRGWVQVMRGGVDADAGLLTMLAGLAAVREGSVSSFGPHMHCLLAEAYLNTGRPQEGLASLAELGPITGRPYEAELHRLRGELLQVASGTEPSGTEPSGTEPPHAASLYLEAEECLQRALVVARGQGARLFELRAAASLARLRLTQGRRDEAREPLASVYGWFTEGFGTPDLVEARALLERM